MADEAGTVIANRYELSEVIGKGSQGMVWKATDTETRTPVAVKMLAGATARDREFVERLRREQTVMRALSGTCAVAAFDFCTSPGGLPCLVMELLDGIDFEQSLRQLAQRGERVELDVLIELLEPIVVALERAHGANIVHRDLKPANVFLQSVPGGQAVRLLDFGLARVRTAQPLTAVGTIIGSPAYMAPEVWKGRPDLVDARADVYSLGVLVFRALAGKVPFDAPTLPAQLVLVTTAARPSLCALRSDLPRALDAWAARALAIDPASRFADVRVMWDALRLCASPKKKGLLGMNPLTSAWKVARSAMERIAGRPGSPVPYAPPPAAAASPPVIRVEPAASDVAPAASHTAAGEAAGAPAGRASRRTRSLPHLPPPPAPRATNEKSASRKTLPEIPAARANGSGPKTRPQIASSRNEASEAKTQLWIRPPQVHDAHTAPTVVGADVAVAERASASEAPAMRSTVETRAVTATAVAKKKPAKKKTSADPTVKKKTKRPSTKSESSGASRKKSPKRETDAAGRRTKAKKVR